MDEQRLRGIEETLAALLYHPGRRTADPLFASLRADELQEAAAEVRRMVLGRAHRGTGGVREWYAGTLAAWLVRHPEDGSLERLAREFCASEPCAAWREGPASEVGISLEEAFYRFFADSGVGDPVTREEEFLSAVFRALAITPGARFRLPGAARQVPGGWYAVSGAGVLHAALAGGRYLHGPLPELAVLLLRGHLPGEVARQTGHTLAGVTAVAAELRRILEHR